MIQAGGQRASKGEQQELAGGSELAARRRGRPTTSLRTGFEGASRLRRPIRLRAPEYLLWPLQTIKYLVSSVPQWTHVLGHSWRNRTNVAPQLLQRGCIGHSEFAGRTAGPQHRMRRLSPAGHGNQPSAGSRHWMRHHEAALLDAMDRSASAGESPPPHAARSQALSPIKRGKSSC